MNILFLYWSADAVEFIVAQRIGQLCTSLSALVMQHTKTRRMRGERSAKLYETEVLAVNRDGFMTYIVSDSGLKDFMQTESFAPGSVLCYERCWFKRGEPFILIRQTIPSLQKSIGHEDDPTKLLRRSPLIEGKQCGYVVTTSKGQLPHLIEHDVLSDSESDEEITVESDGSDDWAEEDPMVEEEGNVNVWFPSPKAVDKLGGGQANTDSTVEGSTTACSEVPPRKRNKLLRRPKRPAERWLLPSRLVISVRALMNRLPAIKLYSPSFVKRQILDLGLSLRTAVTSSFNI